VNHPNCILIII